MSIAYTRKIREFNENGSFNVGVVGVIAINKEEKPPDFHPRACCY